MAITGRLGLLALLGAAFVGLVMPSVAGVLAVAAVLLLGVLADLVLAGGVRALTFARSGRFRCGWAKPRRSPSR